MKKAIFIVVLVVFFMNALGISYAQEGCPIGDKEKKGGMKKWAYPMRCMMMKKMMSKKMVATKDGGVVVLFGNKLLKYDKKLNLVKEAEIKIDKEEMMKKMEECREMMMEMKEKCPMYEKMMKEQE